MQLLMIRHSFAADPGSVLGGDFTRPLTDRGQRVFSHMAMWLVGRGIVPERILHSPLVRAQQTAAILAQACGRDLTPEEARPWIGSGFTLDQLLEDVTNGMHQTVAVVGHEPRMSSCTSAMVAGGNLQFLPATIACIRFDAAIREGQGILEWMLNPKQFPS